MSDDELRAAFLASRRKAAIAAAAYAALKKTGRLDSHRLVTYRCWPERDMLLDVLSFPQGAVFHQPNYKLPPAVNEATSNESGRKANTMDGNKHCAPGSKHGRCSGRRSDYLRAWVVIQPTASPRQSPLPAPQNGHLTA